jgi:hypothetical protein
VEQDREDDGFAHQVGKRPRKEPLFDWERLAATRPSWLAFLGDENNERRLVRGLGLSVFGDALLVRLWAVWRQAALDVGAVVTNPKARANIAMVRPNFIARVSRGRNGKGGGRVAAGFTLALLSLHAATLLVIAYH